MPIHLRTASFVCSLISFFIDSFPIYELFFLIITDCITEFLIVRKTTIQLMFEKADTIVRLLFLWNQSQDDSMTVVTAILDNTVILDLILHHCYKFIIISSELYCHHCHIVIRQPIRSKTINLPTKSRGSIFPQVHLLMNACTMGLNRSWKRRARMTVWR